MKSIVIHFPWKAELQSPILRQTPGNNGIWKDYQFHVNKASGAYDFLVVYGGNRSLINTPLPKKNTLFIASEPPSIKKYSESYLSQFGGVICTDSEHRHPNLQLQQQGYPWFSGIRFLQDGSEVATKHYDDYKRDSVIQKSKLLSVVCSTKQSKPGHRKRFEFVQRLKEELGDELDWFGNGQDSVADKADAIRPYQYHIVIENSSYKHYWTEKLSDCFLEGAFPFYAGCPNIGEYFPHQAYQTIDLNKPEEAVQLIRTAIRTDRYQQSLEALKEAKRQVLDDYNLFNMITEYFDRVSEATPNEKQAFKAYPEKWHKKGPLYRMLSKVREWTPKRNSKGNTND